MAQPDALELAYFQEQMALAQKMAEVLRSSVERATPIIQLFETDSTAPISLEQAEILEALTARFARLSDTVTQKLFRAIEVLELSDSGSLIDRFNRIERRGIVTDAQVLIDIRKQRNQIAHDYVLEDLIPLYQSVFNQCEQLLNIVVATGNYARDNLENNNA